MVDRRRRALWGLAVDLRCHGVVQKDIHISFVDLVHDFLPHRDVAKMLVQKGEIKWLGDIVSARGHGRENTRMEMNSNGDLLNMRLRPMAG